MILIICSFIERRFKHLKPLIALDPNLLPIIMFICPKPELPQLLPEVPPYLSLSWLSYCYLTEITGVLNKDEVNYSFCMIY